MFGATVKGIRGADAQVKTIKDVGEYDLWSKVVVGNAQAGELLAFSYQVGGIVSGTGVNANKLDTNMRTTGQLVDESMAVYGIAICIERVTARRFQTGLAIDYPATILDFESIEMATLFRFMVGGEKPFAEGRVTWFAEAGGVWGSASGVAAANGIVGSRDIVTNNVPTHASLRTWEYKLPIGRIERFWGEFSWPGSSPLIGVIPAQTANTGNVGIICRLVGVRARGVS